MYVTRIPNRDSRPAVLLRESYREDGKVKSRTLANISDWPEAKIDSLRRVLAGETLVPLGEERFEIARALAHGHVAAALGTVRRLGLDKMLPNGPERRAKLILAMIVARIVEPAAKLATARQLSEATAAHSLGAVLGLGEVDEDELYAALDLSGPQPGRASRKSWPNATSRTACSCSTTSPRAIWRGGAANWRNSATAAIIAPTDRRSSSGSCARRRAVRSPSRCSKAISATRPPSPLRSRSCAPVFG